MDDDFDDMNFEMKRALDELRRDVLSVLDEEQEAAARVHGHRDARASAWACSTWTAASIAPT